MCLRAFASVKPKTRLKTSTTYDIRFTKSLTTTTSHGCAGWGAAFFRFFAAGLVLVAGALMRMDWFRL